MASINIKDVDDKLHEALKIQAAKERRSIRDLVLEGITFILSSKPVK